MGLKAVATLVPGGGAPVGGSGTPGKLAKFATASSIGDSVVTELAGKIGINVVPGTLLSVGDGIVSPPSYDGIRLGNTAEALFSSSDSIRGFRAGVTGATVVAGSTTSHDLLLQRGNVTALTLGASGAVTFAGNLTSSAAQTWTLAAGTSALNIQSGLLNLDTTNSRVGIGTASPIGTLEVRAANPTIICSNSSVRYGYSVWNDASSEFRTGTGGAHAFTLLTSNTERMRIDATGNVGIGTASPTHKLQVVGELGLYNAGVDAVYGDVLFMGASPYQTTFRHKIKASISATAVSSLMTFSLTSGASTFIDVMTLRGDGNVGIGTTSPAKKLDVNGAANVTGALTVAGSVSRTSGSTAGVANGAFIVVPVPETYRALLLSSTTTNNETLSSLHLIGSDGVNCSVAAINVFQTTVANNGAAASVRITNASGITATVKWSFLQIS